MGKKLKKTHTFIISLIMFVFFLILSIKYHEYKAKFIFSTICLVVVGFYIFFVILSYIVFKTKMHKKKKKEKEIYSYFSSKDNAFRNFGLDILNGIFFKMLDENLLIRQKKKEIETHIGKNKEGMVVIILRMQLKNDDSINIYCTSEVCTINNVSPLGFINKEKEILVRERQDNAILEKEIIDSILQMI